jgi:hypothetical protein
MLDTRVLGFARAIQGRLAARGAARTDASGAYTIKTFSGAALRARASGRVSFAQVGGANVDAEQVDSSSSKMGRPDRRLTGGRPIGPFLRPLGEHVTFVRGDACGDRIHSR